MRSWPIYPALIDIYKVLGSCSIILWQRKGKRIRLLCVFIEEHCNLILILLLTDLRWRFHHQSANKNSFIGNGWEISRRIVNTISSILRSPKSNCKIWNIMQWDYYDSD